MDMRSLLKLYVPVLGIFVVSSCDFLGVTETTNLDQEATFSDSTFTSQFLNQIYSDIGFDIKRDRYSGHGGLQTASDEAAYKANTGGATDIYFVMGNITPMTTAEDDVWRIAYRNIRRVNMFLLNVDGCSMNETKKTYYKAEARFLRAWYYAMLLRHYGGVPIVYDDVYDSVEDAQKARDTYETCVEYICNEAKTAAEILPAEWSGNNAGRITSGACYALISRVRLYAASPLFNGGDFAPVNYPEGVVAYPNYDKGRWKTALDAALYVIGLNRYSLYCRNTDENNAEFPGWGWYASLLPADFYSTVGMDVYSSLILERRETTNGQIATQQLFFPISMGGNGTGGYLYHDLVAAYPMRDGKYGQNQLDNTYIEGENASLLKVGGTSKYTYTPILLSVTNNDPTKPDLPERDPRLQFMAIYDGCPMAQSTGVNQPINTYVGAGQDAIYQGTPTGYYVRKFTKLNSTGQFIHGGNSQNRPLIRYAEILLNYAEASNEWHDNPNVGDDVGGVHIDPYMALREIRRCAGIEPGDDNTYGIPNNLTQEQMRAFIQMERRLELAFEGHRFFDVRRWMVYGKENTTTSWWMHGMEITKDVNSGVKTGRVFETRQYTFRKAMYLYPIPYKETVKSPDLVQNPYYE